eukprot:5874-Prorocentrum_minimum.AAC.1
MIEACDRCARYCASPRVREQCQAYPRLHQKNGIPIRSLSARLIGLAVVVECARRPELGLDRDTLKWTGKTLFSRLVTPKLNSRQLFTDVVCPCRALDPL